MQCCFHDKKKLPYRVKWGVFTFYVRCVIALKTNDNTSPQPRTVLLEVEQYKHLLNCHYVIQRNRGFLDEYCINMRSLRHTKSRNRKGYENQACFSKELALYKMRFVHYDLSSKNGTRNDHQKGLENRGEIW